MEKVPSGRQTDTASVVPKTTSIPARSLRCGCDEAKVSPKSQRVRPSGSGFVLVDLNSTNGSYVNRQRISQHQLVDGDELGFGHTYFFFEAF